MEHKWDGDLVELNNPLPSWWVNLFWITMVFAVVYLVLYPGLGQFQGRAGWTSFGEYDKEVEKAKAKYDPVFNQFMGQPVEQVAASAEARDMGQRLFLTYCAQCHGSDAGGATGFPNLADKDWLYAGDAESIKASIANGRAGVMPALGAALARTAPSRSRTTCSRSLAPTTTRAWQPPARPCSKPIAPPATCLTQRHGRDGRRPNLTDKVWLYGGSESAIMRRSTRAANGVMPAQLQALAKPRSIS